MRAKILYKAMLHCRDVGRRLRRLRHEKNTEIIFGRFGRSTLSRIREYGTLRGTEATT